MALGASMWKLRHGEDRTRRGNHESAAQQRLALAEGSPGLMLVTKPGA